MGQYILKLYMGYISDNTNVLYKIINTPANIFHIINTPITCFRTFIGRTILNLQTGCEIVEEWCQKALSEDVSVLSGRQNMENVNETHGNLISDKMNVNLVLFGALVLNRVKGYINCTNFVTINNFGFDRPTT